MGTNKPIKKALIKYQKDNNLSANEMAKLFGVTKRTYLYWKSGKYNPSGYSLVLILDKMNLK